MRGALGDLVCTEGDTNYDLSKVYQSLCGYDFFILDKDIDVNAAKMLHDLEEVNKLSLSFSFFGGVTFSFFFPCLPSNSYV